MTIQLNNGVHRGTVKAPPSKSHLQRLLIADFLAGAFTRLIDLDGDCDDVLSMKRCLRALLADEQTPLLDCGASAATRRFLAPVAAALGKRPIFKMAGRLSERPQIDYPELSPGEFRLRGDESSQFVTGLLFALPLFKGDSNVILETPLASRGYVDLTLQVLRGAGITVIERAQGYGIPGGQTYHAQVGVVAQGDWSAAAFWLGMNVFGSAVEVTGLEMRSLQPDRMVMELLRRLSSAWKGEEIGIDVLECPDLFPVLAVVAAGMDAVTTFTGISRLRHKESDRVAAMAEVLRKFGVDTVVGENVFKVLGKREPFAGGDFDAFADHRVAMAIAVGATRAKTPIELTGAEWVNKSYPNFFIDFVRTGGNVVGDVL